MQDKQLSKANDSELTQKSARGLFGLGGLALLYGSFVKLTAGYFCPVCLFLAPVLIMLGVWKKFFYRSWERVGNYFTNLKKRFSGDSVS